jgi:hypothetical protein
MYYLFRYLKWPPQRYVDMPPGGRLVVRAFMHYMVDEMNEETRAINSGG